MQTTYAPKTSGSSKRLSNGHNIPSLYSKFLVYERRCLPSQPNTSCIVPENVRSNPRPHTRRASSAGLLHFGSLALAIQSSPRANGYPAQVTRYRREGTGAAEAGAGGEAAPSYIGCFTLKMARMVRVTARSDRLDASWTVSSCASGSLNSRRSSGSIWGR